MILVVLFYAQHAAVTNCEQTVGDNITLTNVPFSFNDRFTERKKPFRTPFHETKYRLNLCFILWNATKKVKT